MRDYHSQQSIDEISNVIKDILTGYYVDPESAPASPGADKRALVDAFGDANLPKDGKGLKAVLDLFDSEVVTNSIKTWHPLFMNQMSAGVALPAVLGDLFSSMLNCTMATWEMTPVATIIERNVSRWMASLLGMKPGSSGIFIPGGSLSNLFALTVARDNKFSPKIATDGLQSIEKRGAILCSEACHYSIGNTGNLLGLGKDHIIKVASNERGEMLMDDLHAKLAWCDQQGILPFAVVATMGLTVTGGFDPLEEIAEVCRERDMHLHVDAAFGGGMALTKAGKDIFAGIEHADTVIWDAHKWFHTPLTCTALLAPDARIFKHSFSTGADYLFHPQEEEIDLADDLGHYTFLCGKRFDALPIWFTLETFGTQYFHDLADQAVALTEQIHAAIEAHPDFQPTYRPISPIICFRYLPEGSEKWPTDYTNNLQRWVREEAKRRKLAMFNITKFKGGDHFRMILINPLTTREHVETLLTQLVELGREYVAANPVETRV